MNILFLAHRIPYPPNKGDKLRAFNEIKYLGKNNAVDVCTLIDDPRDTQYIEPLSRYCRRLETAQINAKFKKALSLFSLFSTAKTCTESYFYSRELQDKVNRLLENNAYDVIFLYCSSMKSYIPDDCSIPVAIDFVDIDSDKWLQYARYARFPVNIVYNQEGKKLAKLEQRILQQVKASFFVTDLEVQLFSKDNPKVYGIPNGIDFAFFDPAITPDNQELKAKRYLCFTGAMDYFPNEDGVEYFVQSILPIIWKREPKLEFFIVGRNPTQRVCRLADDPRITVTGSVDDIRPYIKHALVAVTPLRMARGIQNKILEAMAMDVPVVASSNAHEGLLMQNGRDMWVDDEPDSFACHVLELVRNPDARHRYIASAAQVLKNHYDWSKNLSRMEKILSDITNKK